MIPSGRIAYAHSRILARKSHLLGGRDAAALLVATDEASLAHALAALGIDPDAAFARLVDLYALAIRTVRAPLFRALAALHEVENVKLMWRVAERNRDRAFIPRLWRPLGALATVRMIEDAASVRDLAERLAKTPYGAIAMSIVRSGADAGEALDRWASQRLLDAARDVPEAITREMIELLVRERDLRAKSLAVPATEHDRRSLPAAQDERAVLRRRRLRLCRRSFVGSPFLLAPLLAVLLLAEEEVRAIRALVERGGDAALDDVTLATIAGSQMSEA